MKPLIAFSVCVLSVGLLQGQMSIDSAGPVNAASYIPARLPNSGVARGAIFVVKGTGLCAPGYTKVASLPLPVKLNGTSALVTSGGSALNIYMIYVYGGLKDADGNTFDQIAGLLPSLTPPGNGTLTVYYGGTSAQAPITVLNTGPGIFALNQAGHGPGVITDNDRFQANTAINSFHDRMWVNLWVTGMGPLAVGQHDELPPPFGSPDLNFDLLIGGRALDRSRIEYWGRAPENPGLDQIAFQPPPGITGCSVPVALRVGSFVSNTVTMSLGPSARCSDPLGPTAAEMDRMERGQPINRGDVSLVRLDLRIQTKDAAGNNLFPEGTADIGYGRFSRYDSALAPFSREVVGLPAIGNCIVQYDFTKNPATFDQALNLTSDPVPHTVLNAGANLSLTGPGVPSTRQVGAPEKGGSGATALFDTAVASYYGLLGAELQNVDFAGGVDPLFLNGGNVTLQTQAAPGGIGPINRTITVPAANRLDWPDRNRVGPIERNQGYTATWMGGNPEEVVVLYGHSGGISGPTATPGASFVCTANAADHQFTIPPLVLLQLPNSRQPLAGIFSIGTAPLSNAGLFTADGLESGRFTFSQRVIRSVTYQ